MPPLNNLDFRFRSFKRRATIDTEDTLMRLRASRELKRQTDSVPEHLRALLDRLSFATEHNLVCREIAKEGNNAVRPLIDLLETGNEQQIAGAAMAMSLIRPNRLDASVALAKLLQNKSHAIKVNAIQALQKLNVWNEQIAQAVAEMLSDNSFKISRWAFYAIRSHKEFAPVVLKYLIFAMRGRRQLHLSSATIRFAASKT